MNASLSTGRDVGRSITDAARVLSAHGLVTAFGHVSARVGDTVLITPPTALDDIAVVDLVAVSLDAVELPAGAAPETWAHLAVYRRRPDVAAIARAQPESTFAAGALGGDLAPLHGQAAWLGRRIPVHPVPRLLRTAALADAAAVSLGDADAMVLRGNGCLATGASPGLAVARVWLLEVACRVWLQAGAAGTPHPLADDDIAAWRAAAPPLLERLWQHLADA